MRQLLNEIVDVNHGGNIQGQPLKTRRGSTDCTASPPNIPSFHSGQRKSLVRTRTSSGPPTDFTRKPQIPAAYIIFGPPSSSLNIMIYQLTIIHHKLPITNLWLTMTNHQSTINHHRSPTIIKHHQPSTIMNHHDSPL